LPDCLWSSTINTAAQSNDAVTVLCSVVNSRITLTGKQCVADSASEYTFRVCSNIDSCFNRPEIIEQIPECQLLVRRQSSESV